MHRILYIIPSLRKGGAEHLVLDICNALQRCENVSVKLITFSELNEYAFLTENINWEVIPASVSLSVLGENRLNIEKLQKTIDQFRPDVIHTHLFEAEIVSRSCYYPQAKWFSHCHDNMMQFENFSLKTLFTKYKFTNFFEKLYLIKQYKKNGSNHFIAISKDTESYFKSVLPKPLKKDIHLLPNAIDFNKFYNHDKTNTNNLKLITIGSLIDKKNQMFLIEVIKQLHYKNYMVKLDILGEGPNRNRIKKEVEKSKLNEYISLKGNINIVENYLWESAIYIHSAPHESFGLVILEAMAAGLPVVTLDGKGNRDIIEDGKNGFMIYEQNAELFADKIIELIENRKLYQQMSAYCVEFARKYDIKEYMDRLVSLYERALA